MTDRDPGSSPADSSGAGSPRAGSPGATLRDRWWWSPTLAIALGVVVVGYQLEALRGDDPLWLNWVVAALGLVAIVYGAVGLLRAYRSR